MDYSMNNKKPNTSQFQQRPLVSAIRAILGVAVLAAPLLMLPGVAEAAVEVTPTTGEQVVNAYTTDSQRYPSMAMDADGDFVVVWNSSAQDGDGKGVYGQRYNAAGVAQGSEFPVNTYTTGHQTFASVAMDSDGDFVVVWESYGQDDVSSKGVYGQRYNAAGGELGSEFLVNTYTTGHQTSPSVAMDSDGDFVVVWESYGQDGSSSGIYGQRYNAAGVAQGSEFPVNTYTTSRQDDPSVAMDADGDFVVVWQSSGQDGGGIYGQRYNAAGVAQGSEFPVNTYTTGSQSSPSVAMDADGDFVVVWESYGQDGDGYGIYGQRYNAAGLKQGAEFPVNTYTTSYQTRPSVAMDADGDFIVVWNSYIHPPDSDDYGIFARTYRADGTSDQTEEFIINTEVEGDQEDPVVAMDDSGDFAIAWSSGDADPEPVDRSGYDVILRTYRQSTTTCIPCIWLIINGNDSPP